MKKETFKKIISSAVILIFLLMSTIPAINASIPSENTENIITYIEKQNMSDHGGNNDSTYDLIIIAPKRFKLPLNRLVRHKNNIGVKTKLFTLDEVYDQIITWKGRDKPEKIKYFIKLAYDEFKIKYVLLVGDFRNLPLRYVHNEDLEGGYHEPTFISDLYYADIIDSNGNFSSWDTNNNGVFGEWSGEEAQDKDIDLYPDIAVGRLACITNIEVLIMVKKIITYEKTTYGKEWFNRIVVAGGDTYPNATKWPAIEGEETCKRVLENMSEFENTTLFTSDGSWSGPKDIISAINKGCGFFFGDAHANPRVWGTHPPNSGEWIWGLKTYNMPFLFNGRKLPVVVVGGCHNFQIDVHPLKILEDGKDQYTWIPECWGWKFVRKIGGGAIAGIGCTGLGMTKEDKDSFEGASDYLEPQLFYEYGQNKSSDILGELWAKALTNYLDKYPIDWDTPAAWDYAIDAKTVQQWILLGDPSLKIGGYSN
jgi:hypothetical protein